MSTTDTDAADRASAIFLRDTGTTDGMDATLHPTEEDDYEAAIAHQWGGPKEPRWLKSAMTRLSKDHADQRGRRALITGGSGGIGFFAAKILAAVGLVIVLPARPGLEFEARGAAAAIRAAVPGAKVEVPKVTLDLASYDSVRAFGAHLRADAKPLDVLCLNAARGGSSRDTRQLTSDGEEATVQVNLLSHALLVRELLPNLQASRYARIVAHTSNTRQNVAQSALDDLKGGGYSDSPFYQYGVSKAALCLYARALNRKLAGAGVRGAASVADPGVAATGINYQHELVRSLGLNRRGVKSTRAYHDGYALHAADAALPLVHAALAGEPNEFWLGEQIGPRASSMDSAAHRAGHLLWPPLRPNDPFNWPMAAVERLWSRVEKLASIEPWPTGAEPVGAATPTGGGAKKKEEL